MTDYSAWSLDQLQARFVETGLQFTQLANERQALLSEMAIRETRSAAVTRLSTLSDKEKDALREVLGPKADAKAVSEGDVIVVTK